MKKYRIRSSAFTLQPVKVHLALIPLTDEERFATGSIWGLSSLINGTGQMTREALSEEDIDFGLRMNGLCITVHLRSGELHDGSLVGMVIGEIPAEMRDDLVPWRLAQEEEGLRSGDERYKRLTDYYPIGILRIPALQRHYPQDFEEETKRALLDLAACPVRGELEDYTDLLLKSL